MSIGVRTVIDVFGRTKMFHGNETIYIKVITQEMSIENMSTSQIMFHSKLKSLFTCCSQLDCEDEL
jgi:hypothetical protein